MNSITYDIDRLFPESSRGSDDNDERFFLPSLFNEFGNIAKIKAANIKDFATDLEHTISHHLKSRDRYRVEPTGAERSGNIGEALYRPLVKGDVAGQNVTTANGIMLGSNDAVSDPRHRVHPELELRINAAKEAGVDLRANPMNRYREFFKTNPQGKMTIKPVLGRSGFESNIYKARSVLHHNGSTGVATGPRVQDPFDRTRRQAVVK